MGSSSPEGREDEATERGPAVTPAPSRSELRKAIVLIQHQLNNPLAALLAEAQLLGMEPELGAEQRAAAARITELTRRVIALVRDLDAIAGRAEAEAEQEADPANIAGNG
jgi:signal transduction histidine kinase